MAKKRAARTVPALQKCPTGIRGLDDITEGGLPKGRPTLVCGGAGCGKTLLAMEFIVRGIRDFGEPGVFMAFEESIEELTKNVASLGFDLAAMIRQKKLAIDYVHIERSEIEETGEYDLEGLFVRLDSMIKEVGAKRVAIDSLEALFAGLPNEAILRAELRRMFRWLKEKGVTTVITGEQGDGHLTRHGMEEYVSDCVITLDHRVINQIATRRLRVVKYRGSKHGTNEYPTMIDEHGLSVLPISSMGLPVVQAQDGMPVEPNCVYIIPPDHHLGLRHGKLFLAEIVVSHGLRMPIDFFFRCLAEDREERAIGILFSGSGADGTYGARAVRVGGGMVIAQDPRTALFGDLPRSAVAAGLVDHVLLPERMPDAVLQYLQHPYVKGPGRAKGLDAEGQSGDVQDILAAVLGQTGCDFRCYKPPTILRRIGRRMGLLHIAAMPQYLALLHRDPGEVKQLFKDLLINVTAFFRDPEAFEEVRAKAFAPLVETRESNEPLRVWVPACATGEEAYSLAMLLLEELARTGKSLPLQIFATDLDDEALEVARAGFYPESIAADVSPERLLKFFVRKEKGYQVKEALREVLTFATQNVITDPPFSKMDLISCRNLLIYLDADAQTKLMGLFNFALKPGGLLFLGRSETVAGQNDLFESASKKARLCRRLTPTRPLFLDSPILPGKRRPMPPSHATSGSATSNFADVVRLEILRHFAASAVLVDRKGKILQFHGQTDRYLKLPASGPNFNVLELTKDGLSAKLRLAMHKVTQDGKAVILDSVPFARDEVAACARITVAPVSQRAQAEPLLIVFFEDVSGSAAGEAEVLQSPENETIIKRLEDELRATQQDLQSTIHELQSSNEELRAANEEITSTNEELESTNEELVTSSEELQSSNEELTAVVSQLQEKVELLDRSEERFRTLLESSPNAVLLAAPDGTITLVNRQAEAMFGYRRDELLGQAVELLVPGQFRKRHPAHRAVFAAQPERRPMGAGRDLLAVRKDGTEFPVEIGLTPLEMPEGLVTMATIIDITERTHLKRVV